MGKNYSDDKCEQKLKDLPDEVVRVVGPFEYDGIDTSLLPNHERTPKECCAEVSEEIEGKEIS